MTDIRSNEVLKSIIDKLEAEKADRLAESGKNYCDKVKSLNCLMKRVNDIETIIHELKKYLPSDVVEEPKADKSSFKVETNDKENIVKGFISLTKNEYGLIIRNIKTQEICKFASIGIDKNQLPIIIAALQAVYEEMEDG